MKLKNDQELNDAIYILIGKGWSKKIKCRMYILKHRHRRNIETGV